MAVFIYFYLFGVLRRFQHCTGHITTGSWNIHGCRTNARGVAILLKDNFEYETLSCKNAWGEITCVLHLKLALLQ